MSEQTAKRDWFVTIFEYCVMWPIGLWGLVGIVYYFMTEDYRPDELVAAILLAVVGWYRFRPLPKARTSEAAESDDKDAPQSE